MTSPNSMASDRTASSPEAADERAGPLVMTGYQLRAAAEFVNPDPGDTDQLESEVCIQWGPERDDGEGGKEPAGLRVWLADYPEEGSMTLDPDKPWPPESPESALASAHAGAGEGEQHAPVSPELDATMLWLGETRDSLRAMADRANQLLTAHCRAALAGEPAVAADEGRETREELLAALCELLAAETADVPLMRDKAAFSAWSIRQTNARFGARAAIAAARAASQDEQQEKHG